MFFLAVIYEALKTLRELLLYVAVKKQKERKRRCKSDGDEMSKIDKAGTFELGMNDVACKCPSKKTHEPVLGFANLLKSKW